MQRRGRNPECSGRVALWSHSCLPLRFDKYRVFDQPTLQDKAANSCKSYQGRLGVVRRELMQMTGVGVASDGDGTGPQGALHCLNVLLPRVTQMALSEWTE